jgi:hypothetical protein
MKTKVIMNSPDRFLFGKIIRQDTNGMLSMTDLQEVSNKVNVSNGNKMRQLQEILNRDENLERIYYILKEQGYITLEMSKVIVLIKKMGLFTYLKSIKVYKTTGARQTKSTWANPYIWMLAALELSPQLYGKAVTWLTDNLIINRIEAGNMYRGLTNAVSKFKNIDYIKLAKALNYIVFGKHKTGIRNQATQHQLKELEDLEKKMAFAVDMGYIKSFDDLLFSLRKIWHSQHNKEIK